MRSQAHSVRTIITLIFALFSFTLSSRAVEADETPAAGSGLVFKKGTRALQFEISSADLGAFNGAMFSGKYHFSPASAVRYGIGIVANTGTSKYESSGTIQDGDNQSFTWEMALQYVYYSAPSAELKPFWVSGLRGRYTWQKQVQKTGSSGSTYDADDRIRQWGVGMLLGFGLEWMPAKRFGLSGEYRSAVTYQSSIRESNRRYPGEPWTGGRVKSSSLGFDQDGVRFGLSVYF